MQKSLSITQLQKKVLPILQKHEVRRASIFGSFARGEAIAKLQQMHKFDDRKAGSVFRKSTYPYGT